jgi:hypothetical protein
MNPNNLLSIFNRSAAALAMTGFSAGIASLHSGSNQMEIHFSLLAVAG